MTDFTADKPTAEGIYRVRGWHLRHPKDTAVVVVAKYRGQLVCNLHESTSETDRSQWARVSELCEWFKWQLVEPTP